MKFIKHNVGWALQGRNLIITTFLIYIFSSLTSCKKFIEVDEVADRILSDQVFQSDGGANSAILGMYRLSKDGLIISTSLYNSLASDDIKSYSPNTLYDNYAENAILPNNSVLPWAFYYRIIYAANAAIEGMGKSTEMSEKAKQYYTAEARFNRAFCYFELVNLFGEVPLILSTDVNISATASRTTERAVYDQIISDLTAAQSGLGNDYSYTGGGRNRANKWVATALLARVYLYLKDWNNAKEQANAVINSGQYALLNGPSGIFNTNNQEALLQWANNTSDANTVAGNFIFTTSPGLICTDFLLTAFEINDLRKGTWIKQGTYQSQNVYYPFKFTTAAAGPNEAYTVMRLAEQYLIRAEAEAMLNNLSAAIGDVNVLRNKHGGLNTPLNVPVSQTDCINLILKERQVEFFTEGMHRWFDLKRTGRLDDVMKIEKPNTWRSYAALYPIPLGDLQKNKNLKQNLGYK